MTQAAVPACSLINAILVEPTVSPVGGTVSVSASTTDSSAAYAWSATSGFFDSATSPETHFTCTDPGQAVVTLELTDGACHDHASAFIMCK